MKNYIQHLHENNILGKYESSSKKNFILDECPFEGCKRLSVSSETGAWHCWKCEGKGSFNGLCKKLGINLLGAEVFHTPIEYNCVGRDDAILYGESRSIKKDLIEELEIGYKDGYIIIPYFRDNDIVGIKKKNVNSSEDISYLSEGNTKYYLLEVNKNKKEIFVCEGEFDAISLYTLEVNAIAVGGVGKWKSVINVLRRYEKVYIAFDSDMAGVKAANALQDELKYKATVLKFPYKDPNEWLQNGGSKFELKRIVSEGKGYSSGIVRRADSYGTSALEYLKNPNIVEGIPTGMEKLDKALGGGKRQGEVTVVHAEAKTGKNTLYHTWILSLLKRSIPVGYASRELSPDYDVLPDLWSLKFKRNFRKYNSDILEDEALLQLKRWPLYFADGYGHFPLDEFESWIIECNELGVNHFFIDHLHYCLEEEDYKMAGKMIKSMKTLAKKRFIHIDLIVQPTKLPDSFGTVSRHTIKGGSSIEQAIDNLLILKREEEKNISSLTLEFARSKLARCPTKIFLEYNPETTELIEGEMITEEKEFKDVKEKRVFGKP